MEAIISFQVSILKSLLLDLKNKTKDNVKYNKLTEEIDNLFERTISLNSITSEDDTIKIIMSIMIPLMLIKKKIEDS